MFCISYNCEACKRKFNTETKIKKHLETRLHKIKVDDNAPYKCELCAYKSYNSFYFYMHKRNTHKIKKINNFNKSQCKKKINDLLIQFKNKNIDPNQYFNYKYYAVNINLLDRREYNDFLKELQNITI